MKDMLKYRRYVARRHSRQFRKNCPPNISGSDRWIDIVYKDLDFASRSHLFETIIVHWGLELSIHHQYYSNH